MSSIDTTAPPKATMDPKSSGSKPGRMEQVVDVALRVLLFATALVSIIVMVNSKQTKLITLFPGLSIPVVAKFDQSPAFVYLVHYNICYIPQRQIRGIPGDLSLGIPFPGDMSPGISGTE
ncbi:CASP-like protein 1 [Tanacetum coccineum]